jgi:hypothetical protein
VKESKMQMMKKKMRRKQNKDMPFALCFVPIPTGLLARKALTPHEAD